MEPFRRPTPIPLDPAPSSAALAHTDFVPKSFAKGKGPQALQRCLPRRSFSEGGAQSSVWSRGQCRPVDHFSEFGCQCGLQGSGSVARTGPVGLVRDRMPLPPDKAASPKSARRPQAFVVRIHAPSRSPESKRGWLAAERPRAAASGGLRLLHLLRGKHVLDSRQDPLLLASRES